MIHPSAEHNSFLAKRGNHFMIGQVDQQTDMGEEVLPDDLRAIATLIRDAAQLRQGNCNKLLTLLRLLEHLHREISDGLFQTALPDNRQALYSLLKDIETSGGWPYIHRMRLQALLVNLALEPASDHSEEETQTSDESRVED